MRKLILIPGSKDLFPLAVGTFVLVRQDIMVEACDRGGCSVHGNQEAKGERKKRTNHSLGSSTFII